MDRRVYVVHCKDELPIELTEETASFSHFLVSVPPEMYAAFQQVANWRGRALCDEVGVMVLEGLDSETQLG